MNWLLVIQIVVSAVLIFLVMLQSSGSGIGKSVAGGTGYRSRKGLEKGVFVMTIVFGVLFAVNSLLNILL